jgi:arylsulfatase A-like enzyme
LRFLPTFLSGQLNIERRLFPLKLCLMHFGGEGLSRWRHFFRCFVRILAGVLLCATSLSAAEQAVRPNVIVILADDMGFSDIGCYGSEIRTPNLDRLASEGMRFTQFYNASKCEQSRASLLSGLYWEEAQRGIKRGITLAEALHSVGYSTLAAGKWHLDGNPVDRGFDHWFGFLNGASNYFLGNKFFRLDHEIFDVPAKGFYTTDAFTDYAIRFVESAHKTAPEKPFFLYLAYNAPHAPLQAPPEDIARYRGKYAEGWDELRQERYEKQIQLGVIKKEWALSPRPDNIPAWSSLDSAHRELEDQRMAVYAAMVDRMDQNIGRLLTKLHEWRIEENTLVIFLSDNGADPYDRSNTRKKAPGPADTNWEYGIGWANLSNTPFRLYKRNQHEGGIATPFIARWPAVIKKGGVITDQPAHIVDIMATCVKLAGCDYTAAFEGKPSPVVVGESGAPKPNGSPAPVPPLDGTSLLPIFQGETWTGHDALFFQFRDHRAVRAGIWKLDSHEGKAWELYRIDQDRTELHDLATKEPKKLEELKALYEKWWSQPNIVRTAAPHDESPGYVDPFKGPQTAADKGSKIPKHSTDDDD